MSTTIHATLQNRPNLSIFISYFKPDTLKYCNTSNLFSFYFYVFIDFSLLMLFDWCTSLSFLLLLKLHGHRVNKHWLIKKKTTGSAALTHTVVTTAVNGSHTQNYNSNHNHQKVFWATAMSTAFGLGGHSGLRGSGMMCLWQLHFFFLFPHLLVWLLCTVMSLCFRIFLYHTDPKGIVPSVFERPEISHQWVSTFTLKGTRNDWMP